MRSTGPFPGIGLLPGLLVTGMILLSGGYAAHRMSPVPEQIADGAYDPAAPGVPAVPGRSGPGADGGLLVSVTGIRSGQGKVVVLVFDDAGAFGAYDQENAAGVAAAGAAKGRVSLRFPGLPARSHAVVVHHDENGNGEFDMAGEWPLEGYGVSGAAGPFDEPDFEAASVDAAAVSVKMHYLN